jgi:hypothetical protein
MDAIYSALALETSAPSVLQFGAEQLGTGAGSGWSTFLMPGMLDYATSDTCVLSVPYPSVITAFAIGARVGPTGMAETYRVWVNGVPAHTLELPIGATEAFAAVNIPVAAGEWIAVDGAVNDDTISSSSQLCVSLLLSAT